MTREGKESERKVTDVAHIRNTSSLAEFCRQPQNNLFKKVQAEFNSPITNYGVRDIETDINDFADDEQEMRDCQKSGAARLG